MMTTWQIKKFGELAGVSVRTLHHYDKIGLLKPSIRQTSGYRLYSETDLLKLQQIIALKFFGFDLATIKTLLDANVDVRAHFSMQSQRLEEKAKTLLEASKTLNSIIATYNDNRSIHWEKIIQLIEVYRMTQKLEQSWAGKALTPEELKEYANFQQSLSKEDEDIFKQAWVKLVGEIDAHLDDDPESKVGIAIGERCMELINRTYGKKHAALRSALWEKGVKSGASKKHGLSPKGVDWLDKAMSAYYKQRIYTILDQVDAEPSTELLATWHHLLEEMCGESKILKTEIYDAAMEDTKVSAAAKTWLRQM